MIQHDEIEYHVSMVWHSQGSFELTYTVSPAQCTLPSLLLELVHESYFKTFSPSFSSENLFSSEILI